MAAINTASTSTHEVRLIGAAVHLEHCTPPLEALGCTVTGGGAKSPVVVIKTATAECVGQSLTELWQIGPSVAVLEASAGSRSPPAGLEPTSLPRHRQSASDPGSRPCGALLMSFSA
jgi:hypothetical protein